MTARKVLLIVPLSTTNWGSHSAGGVDSVCQMLVKSLISNQYNAFKYRVVAFDPTNSVKAPGVVKVFGDCVELVHYNADNKSRIPNFITQNIYINAQIKDFAPDLVHSHLISWIFNASYRLSLLLTLHGHKKIGRKSYGFLNDLLFAKIAPFIANFTVDRYTCVSQYFNSRINSDIKKPISVIYNPIEENYLKERIRPQTKSLNIVTCALINRKKGIHHIIEILYLLRMKGLPAKLNVIGPMVDDTYALELRTMITKYALNDYVCFLGHKETRNIIAEYDKSDIGIFLSELETFGLAPLEMLAVGLPVIASNTGVISDLISKDVKVKNLCVVAPGSYNEIVEEITYFNCNRSLKNAGETRVADLFTPSCIISGYESTYKLMLG